MAVGKKSKKTTKKKSGRDGKGRFVTGNKCSPGMKRGTKQRRTVEREELEAQKKLIDIVAPVLEKNNGRFADAIDRLHTEALTDYRAFRVLAEFRRDFSAATSRINAAVLAAKMSVFAELRGDAEPADVIQWIIKWYPHFIIAGAEGVEWFKSQAEFFYAKALSNMGVMLTARNTVAVQRVHALLRMINDVLQEQMSQDVDRYEAVVAEIERRFMSSGLAEMASIQVEAVSSELVPVKKVRGKKK